MRLLDQLMGVSAAPYYITSLVNTVTKTASAPRSVANEGGVCAAVMHAHTHKYSTVRVSNTALTHGFYSIHT